MKSYRSRFRRLLAETESFDTVVRATCDEIEQRIPGSLAAIFAVDGNSFRCCAASDGLVRADLDAAIGAAAAGPWALALSRGKSISCSDMTTDPRCADLRETAMRAGLHGCWFVPIVSTTGKKIGVMAVVHHVPHRPSKRERAAARQIAGLAANAIQRQRIYDGSREAERRLANLMANVPGVVFQWAVTPAGSVELTFISDCARSMTGLQATAPSRRLRRVLRRIPRADRARLLKALKRSIATLEPVTEDFQIDCGEQGVRWLRVTSRPRRRDDGTIISDGLGLDITDSRMAEATLRKSQVELNARLVELHRTKARLESQSSVLVETARELTEARDTAEQASRAKSEFLSNMSHELRTPLNAILGFSEIIREQTFGPVGSPKYRDYASDIHESGLHLLELINDVLDFAKIEAGREELRVENVSIREVVDSVQRMVHERAERAGLTIECSLGRSLPLILADKRKIKQILLNVLSNAIKFTEHGGKVSLSAWCSDQGGFVIQVADTGIGIALEDIPKALGLIGQIDSAFSRRHEGTGLGLPLSKALVEMHGGSLDLQSQPGVGTTVTIRLPSERIVREQTAPAAKAM